MKIHRNYVNPTFCPVLALLVYLHYSGHTSGPIFQLGGNHVDVGTWKRMLLRWFELVGLRNAGAGAKCTSHSVRRSAAQWAGRCGARELDVRNAGRWRSMQILAKYMAQGAVTREEYEEGEEPVQDPIFRMWVFKKVTSASSTSLDMV